MKQNLKLKFNTPINEFSSNPLNKEFVIEGIAINATTTSNNHKFVSEELEKSAHTLMGVPLLKDHNNSIDSIVGRVQESSFNHEHANIPFKAIINDEKARQLIERGDLKTVSVGAVVSEVEEGEDGTMIPKGITFKELSLVAVPADSGATFQVALKEAYNSEKELPEADDLIKDLDESPESKSSVKDTIELKGGQKLKKMEKQTVTQEEFNTLQSSVDSLKELVAEAVSKLTVVKEEVKEADVDEVEEVKEEPKEEKSEEPKESEKSEEVEEAEESEEEVVEEKDYKIVQSGGKYGSVSFTVVRNNKW